MPSDKSQEKGAEKAPETRSEMGIETTARNPEDDRKSEAHQARLKERDRRAREYAEMYPEDPADADTKLAGNGGDSPDTSDSTETEAQDSQSCGEAAPNTNLDAKDFQRVFERNFDRLDTNKDGFVDDAEIDEAIVDPCFTGEDAQLLAVLKQKREDLEELSNDEWGDEDDGVTIADAAKFHELQASENLDEDEMQLVKDIEHRLDWAQDSIGDANSCNRELYGNKDNPLESIRPGAVFQGIYPDCHLMAAIAALANSPQGKKVIHEMIKANGDDTYTVTFPGDPEHPVTITAPTDGELGAYAAGTSHGIWAAVVEKAYGQYCNEFLADMGFGSKVSPHTAMPPLGSPFSTAMELLTGREVNSDLIEFTQWEEVEKDLITAMEEGRPVKCSGPLVDIDSPWKEVLFFDFGSDDNKLKPTHVYSVLAYNKDNKMLTIRDPYGEEFEMSLIQFMGEATNISYGQ